MGRAVDWLQPGEPGEDGSISRGVRGSAAWTLGQTKGCQKDNSGGGDRARAYARGRGVHQWEEHTPWGGAYARGRSICQGEESTPKARSIYPGAEGVTNVPFFSRIPYNGFLPRPQVSASWTPWIPENSA